MTSVMVDAGRWEQGLAAHWRRQQTDADRARAWEDPEWFLREKLNCAILTPKQIEIAESLRDNAQTAVKGANSTGKDYIDGNLVLWWVFCWQEALAVVYGPTTRQVDHIIWREVRKGFNRANGALPGYMYPKAARYEVDGDKRYAHGFSAQSSAGGEGIQGFHSPHLLVIVTEAHAVEDSEIEALVSLLPERLILTGNPLVSSGEFYRAFHAKRQLYNCITIAASDTPNLIEGRNVIPGMATVESVQAMADHYGIDSPVYRSRVLAEFPDSTEDAIINLATAEAAVARTVEPSGGAAVLGVDVARFGEDDSIIYHRQSAIARKVYKVNGRPTTHLAGKVIELCQADPNIKTVVVDTVGVGAGVFDFLAEQQRQIPSVKLIPFVGGARAHRHQRYANRIAEAWWRMRQAFDILDIEKDDELVSQVTTRTYELQRDSVIRLESKVKMRERGAPSPDEADALAMTFAVVDAPRESVRHDRFAATTSTHPLGFTDERYRDTDTEEMPQ
ncbi:hypothetical protein CMI37_14370 [Candidatus Pacearchaeota archaeon]|nr:hypothetical protein [Candidatus Pacearchaeota archaeon]|tara:strand:- start:1255 stop:2766 length:1512 start_codon:yes stop_codon:yes gene_type:complete